MKKLVFAFVMALASISIVCAPMLRAQDSNSTITIKDPAEFNTYQMATSQQDPAARAAALESFLETYPNSVVKAAVLDQLIDTYQSLRDADKTLSAASRLLQVDPNNMKAIFISVFIKKNQCAKTHDAETCDDAALLAQRGLTVSKPASTSDEAWKKLTGGIYPVFHSAIALDDIVSKKDVQAGIAEYRTELMLYPAEQTESGQGLWDTLQLAEAYTKPQAKDLPQAIWFYARAWNYATPIKAQVEADLEYYYRLYHGNLDGLDAAKTLAAATVFPPAAFSVTPAPTPAQIAHNVVTTTPDLTTLALEDKEYILANGSPEDAAKMWTVLKNQVTPVPGVVIDAVASAVRVAVIKDGRRTDFLVNLKTPVSYTAIPAENAGLSEKKEFILTSGAVADTDKLAALLNGESEASPRLVIEPLVSSIKVAVTKDAQAAKVADFVVNLKDPAEGKEIPAVGFEYGIPPATTLVGTYDSYRQIPATATRAATAEIVLRNGAIQLEQKRPTPHKPAAGHHR